MFIQSYFALFILVLSLCTTQAWTNGDNLQEQFLQANELYKKQEFSKALALYEGIPNKSPAVCYNMGNCAYQLGNLGQALAYWRKAQRNWGLTHRAELQDNIKLAKEALQKRMPQEKNKPSLLIFQNIEQAIIAFTRSLPLLTWQLLFLFFWLFFIASLHFLPAAFLVYLKTPLFLLIVFCGSMLSIKYYTDSKIYGIIIKNTNLLSGPDPSYHQIKILYEGQEGLIAGQSGTFYKITVDNTIGWLNRSACERI